MTKTLFLDDSEERQEIAQKYFGKYWGDVTWAWTTKQAIQALKQSSYDLVFLDHDLGGEVFVDSKREDSGMEVVRWIVQNKPQIDTIVIHSWNLPAAKNMELYLRDAGYAVSRTPFSGNIFTVQ